MATASRVRIVHGHGICTEKMVAELLSRHPHVARHYPAPSEGGAGTPAELRNRISREGHVPGRGQVRLGTISPPVEPSDTTVDHSVRESNSHL